MYAEFVGEDRWETCLLDEKYEVKTFLKQYIFTYIKCFRLKNKEQK